MEHQVLLLYYFLAAVLLYAGIVLTDDKYKYLIPKTSRWYFLIDGNNWEYNLLYLINICVFSWLFYKQLETRLTKKLVILSCVFNLLLFIYVDILVKKLTSDFNSLVYGFTFLSIISYTFFYLYQLLSNVKEENLLEDFDFWLISGYVLYYLGSFIIIIFYQNADQDLRGDIWEMNNIVLFACAITLLTAHLLISKSKKMKY